MNPTTLGTLHQAFAERVFAAWSFLGGQVSIYDNQLEYNPIMNQHDLWVPTLKADWFRDLMKFLDGTHGDVTLGAMRDHIGREANLGPLDFMLAYNNAFHVGILQKDEHGVSHFNTDTLDTIIERADANGISVECVKLDCKN